MPIEVEEVKGSRRYGWNGGRHASLQVRVITNDATIGPRAAALAVGVDAGAFYRSPLYGTPTEVDYGIFLNSIEAQEEDADGKSWIVSLEYASINWQETQGGQGDGANASAFIANPLNAPPGLKWSSETEEIAVTHDRDGKPTLNAAGDPFDPVLTRRVATPILTITRMLPTFNPAWIDQFKDHTNASEWMGFPAGTVACRDISADQVHDGDWGTLWSQTLVLAFRAIVVAEDGTVIQPGWAIHVLNAGLRQLVDDKVEQIIIDGAPISSPVALADDGFYDPADSSVPNYLTFNLLEEADFSLFDLPADLLSIGANSSPAGGI